MSLCRLDKIKSTAHIVSFKINQDLKNGEFVVLGNLKTGEREVYEASAPIDVTKQKLVLHSSVPLQYDETALEDDFILKAGKVGRGYILEVGDIITLTDDLFTGTSAIGNLLIPVNGSTKLKVATGLTSATPEVYALKVIEKTYLNGQKATAVQAVIV